LISSFKCWFYWFRILTKLWLSCLSKLDLLFTADNPLIFDIYNFSLFYLSKELIIKCSLEFYAANRLAYYTLPKFTFKWYYSSYIVLFLILRWLLCYSSSFLSLLSLCTNEFSLFYRLFVYSCLILYIYESSLYILLILFRESSYYLFFYLINLIYLSNWPCCFSKTDILDKRRS